MRTLVLFACLTSALLTCKATPASDSSPDDGNARTLLEGMRVASTWGHPDQFGQYRGMIAYARGDYDAAMRLFLIGARYADKPSQLSIGLLYLNGQGVPRDPVQAWAWVALSAERGYSRFAATRDQIGKELDTNQRVRAMQRRNDLALTYGDVVAKRRMSHELRFYSTQLTGSRTGFDSGANAMDVSILDKQLSKEGHGNAQCMIAGRANMRGVGCGGGDLYADWQWNPKVYFLTRDALYNGTVRVGDTQRSTDNTAQREQE
ncbi:sel1 repeat family protein [Dyella sp.]|jgi:hypothetical protein|uniref:sel1 repeat family protein n=1 Tax=Dyella sp. TaxID=1869338 RepID=UPI002D79F629|nr:sel1 repeat family protein [Dyella sp.]HET6433982.1 sel1 repeat family protein [Dyella sp.]